MAFRLGCPGRAELRKKHYQYQFCACSINTQMVSTPGLITQYALLRKWKLYEFLYFRWTTFQYDTLTSDQWQVSDNANTLHSKLTPAFSIDFHW